jgi:hypothetical protein
MEKLLGGIGVGVVALGIIVLLALLTGWITMLCWNYTLPYLFGVKEITYLQGFALNILSGMLLKSTQTNNNK